MASALTKTAAAIGLFVAGCSTEGAGVPLCCVCHEWDDSKSHTVVSKECQKNGDTIDETQDADVCKSKGGAIKETACSEAKIGAAFIEATYGHFGESFCTVNLMSMGQCCKGGEPSGFRNDGKTCQDAPNSTKGDLRVGP
eukprot:TRINITY_DN2239_c0_g1_i2.p1 TRINITY_DN2239_c0_g1~~TRINITY_DN2239_c0_g1_i2.p1  ORF type:complete len:159 (-),score=21.05 TRINITY_DN2239_c0_g1_i2:140-559(-)